MSVRLNPETGEPLPIEQQEFSATRSTGGPFASESGSGSATTPTSEPILQYFAYEHLPWRLAEVSRPFCQLAHAIVLGDNAAEAGTVTMGIGLPRNPERTVALRKLLEAKDAAVRAALAKG